MKLVVVVLVFAAVAVFFIFTLSLKQQIAQENRDEAWNIVPTGEVINQDYGAVAEVVEISGTVRGDVYAVGGQIFIDGIVEGDVLALGGVVHISGTVAQNVRAAGAQVVISGEIDRNATIAATHVTFTDSGNVKGGVVVGGANVFLASPVGREARVAGRNFTLASSVSGDVEAAAENVRLTDGARVGGDFTHWSNQEAFIEKGAKIAGAQTRKSPRQLTARIGDIVAPAVSWVKPFIGFSSFFTSLVLGLLLIRFFPGSSRIAAHTLRKHKWRSLTSGITTLLFIPLLFGILIITIVGIPLGFLLLLVSSVILYSARIFVMLLIGQIVLERLFAGPRSENDSLAFVLGLALYSLLVFIPIAGWVLSFGAMLFGLGAIVETLKETYAKSKKAAEA